MTTGKKPPLDIRELGKEDKEERQPGGLSYVNKSKPKWEGKDPQMRDRGSQNPWIKPLVTAIIAIIISLVAVVQLAPSKANYNLLINDYNALKADYTTYKSTDASDLVKERGRIDNIINTMTTYATKSEIGKFATSDSITSINTQLSSLSNLSGKIDTLTGKLDTLQKTVDDLNTKVVNQAKEIDKLWASINATVSVSIPSISSFTPTSGTTGASVVITGVNFTGATAVYFGGVLAQSFTINSATQITAIVGNGSTGYVSVTTSGGTVSSTGTFTFTGTPTVGNVVVTYSTSAIVLVKQTDGSYSNNFNLTISNGLTKDIFNGQLQLTIQYIGIITPLVDGAGTLTAAGVSWNEPSISSNSFTIVGNTGLYITAGSSTTLTVKFSIFPVTGFTTAQYIRIVGAILTGYMQ